jgi:hypothetical protein
MDGIGINDGRSAMGAKKHRFEDHNGKQASFSTVVDHIITFRGVVDVYDDNFAAFVVSF